MNRTERERRELIVAAYCLYLQAMTELTDAIWRNSATVGYMWATIASESRANVADAIGYFEYTSEGSVFPTDRISFHGLNVDYQPVLDSAVCMRFVNMLRNSGQDKSADMWHRIAGDFISREMDDENSERQFLAELAATGEQSRTESTFPMLPDVWDPRYVEVGDVQCPQCGTLAFNRCPCCEAWVIPTA